MQTVRSLLDTFSLDRLYNITVVEARAFYGGRVQSVLFNGTMIGNKHMFIYSIRSNKFFGAILPGKKFLFFKQLTGHLKILISFDLTFFQ